MRLSRPELPFFQLSHTVPFSRCHPERNFSRVKRERNVVEGRRARCTGEGLGRHSPDTVDGRRRTPCGGIKALSGVGVLRLRDWFALRNTHCAQDDIGF
jgi:hypothetical protein